MSRPFLGIVAYGLLVGVALLHAGFIRGPGEYFLPILLLGIVGGCVLGYRQVEQAKFFRGAAWAISFIGCLFVPYLLCWGWLEWRVRAVPAPPKAEWVSRNTEPIRFTGGYDWHIEGQVNLPAEAIESFRHPSLDKRLSDLELQRVRGETIAGVEDFYRESFARDGWEVGATSDMPLSPTIPVTTRSTTFTRGGEILSLRIIPNTFRLTFLLQRDDPMPFGPVQLPDLPWTRRPAPPTILPNPPGR